MFHVDGGALVLMSLVLRDSDGGYGAIDMNSGSTLTATSCTFMDNKGTARGGAVYVLSSIFDAAHCSFTSNTGTNGAAVYSTFGSTVTLSYCTISGNSASNRGIFYLGATGNMQGTDTVTATHCSFFNNAVGYGVVDSEGGSASIKNTFTGTDCTFSDNSGYGAALMTAYGGSAEVTRCHLTGTVQVNMAEPCIAAAKRTVTALRLTAVSTITVRGGEAGLCS